MPTYAASLVANAFLYKARQNGVELSHMKLQKLVFFMHAWSLALKGESVLADRPEAWSYGPVFNSLYHELKGYGSNSIGGYLLQMNPQTGVREGMIPNLADAEFWSLLDQVWDRYGSFSALQLSALTHEAGSPWEAARSQNTGWLQDDQVQNFYRQKLANGH